jgi:predicted DNA-binding transcriptional regulator AlpA
MDVELIDYKTLGPSKGINCSRDHLRRKVKAGEFPKPIPLSERRIAWIEAEVDNWLAAPAVERDLAEPLNPSCAKPDLRRGKRAAWSRPRSERCGWSQISRSGRFEQHNPKPPACSRSINSQLARLRFERQAEALGKLRFGAEFRLSPANCHNRAEILHYRRAVLEQHLFSEQLNLTLTHNFERMMARQKGSLTGRCQGCKHPERVRVERFLAAGASIKGAGPEVCDQGLLLNIQNNVLVNPDYTRAIARLVSAVGPSPEAREAVIAALRDLDAESSSPPALADRRDERTAND